MGFNGYCSRQGYLMVNRMDKNRGIRRVHKGHITKIIIDDDDDDDYEESVECIVELQSVYMWE